MDCHKDCEPLQAGDSLNKMIPLEESTENENYPLNFSTWRNVIRLANDGTSKWMAH